MSKHAVRVVGICIGIACGLATAKADLPVPTAGRPAQGSAANKKPDPKTLEALLKQGRDALSTGEYKAARDAFHDVAAIDPKNVEALHGLGLSYMYLNDFIHALPPMEKALVANGTPSRALILNMAVCQIGQPGSKNAMRAASLIMDYLTVHSAQLDEPMLNAMATALYVADDQAKKGRKFQDCEAFYKKYNRKLEAAKPGMKRWGVQWLSAQAVDERLATNAASEKQLNALSRDMDAIENKLSETNRTLDKQKDLVRRGFMTQYELTDTISAVKYLTEQQATKQKEYDEAVAKIQRPTFPRAMTLVAMDDLTPPPVAASVAMIDDNPANQLLIPLTVRHSKPNVTSNDKATAPKTEIKTEMPKVEEPIISVSAQQAVHRKVRINSYAAAFPISENLILTAAAPLKDATEIELQAADGSPVKAEILRTDESTGLALLRVADKKLIPMVLAASFTGGTVQCAAYPTVNIFNPTAEPIPGTAKPPAEKWQVSLSRHPRLGGSPLLSGNKIVGIELASRENEPSQIPAATLETIKAFLGSDLPSTPSAGPDPCASMLQVIATRESSGT